MAKTTFREKTVIVTGASSGIGKAVTLQLADEGAWLALAACDAQRLDELAIIFIITLHTCAGGC
ncbi:MAG: SDR family NAD(P)-dependent oxidoreductase [Desulfobacterales bacterium]|nr:MAG: SDR family NAD(P)-dependent oxidoreductase [Desulfobacterales bacterium]